MIDAILNQHLSTHVPVDDRVYAYLLPQNCDYPAVAILEISNTVDYDLSGETEEEQSRYQISAFARTYLEAKEITDAVKASMRLPIDGIAAAIFSNCSPSYESDMELYHIALDYTIHYHRS